MTLEDWLTVADRAYFGAAIVALIATALTIVAGIAQNRLNARIADNKDRAFNEFRINSETRAAELQKLAAEANQKAEEEKLARVKIEARLAPRTLSDDDVRTIAAAMATYKDLPIDIFVNGSSTDTGAVANRIVAALTSAQCKPLAWLWTGAPLVSGIAVAPKSDADPVARDAAQVLLNALKEAGLDVSIMVWPSNAWGQFTGFLATPPPFEPNRSQLRIIVGTKPQ